MGFLKNHLQQSTPDSSAISPKPVHHFLGVFMPPGFEHLENPRRGVDVLAPKPQAIRQSDLFEAIVNQVEPVKLILK